MTTFQPIHVSKILAKLAEQESPTFWQVFDIKIGELFCTFTEFAHTITSRFESSNKNLFIGQHHTIDLFDGTSGSLIGFEMNKSVSFGSVSIFIDDFAGQ